MRLTPIDFAIPKVRLTQEEILADLLYPAEPALASDSRPDDGR